jgi:hypothetical protein
MKKAPKALFPSNAPTGSPQADILESINSKSQIRTFCEEEIHCL